MEKLIVANYVCNLELKDLGIILPCYGNIETPLFWWKDVRNLADIKAEAPSDFVKGIELEDDEIFTAILGSENFSEGKIRHGGLRKGTEITMFSENGLYEILLAKPKLRKFRKPVKHILKTLRQDGMYITGEDIVNNVQELDELLNKAYERKVLRKFGIGVRKDLTSVVQENLNPKNKFLYATITDQLIYKPTVGKTAKELKTKFHTKKLRDEHFTCEELTKIANQEQFVSNLIEKFKDYNKVKEIVNM